MVQEEFDLSVALQRQEDGIRQVAENNHEFLIAARGTAKLVAQSKGTVTSDDVRAGCPLVPLHPNAWGAVFKSKEFVFTGQYHQSKLVSRHGAMQRVWKLAEGSKCQ